MYNAWIGHKVRNTRTGREFTCYDIAGGCILLSGGQIIPFHAIPGHWELVTP